MTLARRSVLFSSAAKLVRSSTSELLSDSGSSLGCDRRGKCDLRRFSFCPGWLRGKGAQASFHHSGNRTRQIGWYSVADLFGDIRLAAFEKKIVGKAHETCGLAMSDGAMFHGVQVSPLLGLEKLGTDRDGWT